MVKTIKIADYKTQRDIKFSVEGNAAKLDNITKFLESGGVLSNPDYGLGAIKTGINDAKKSVGDGKAKVAAAIAAKGIPTAADSTFDTLASNIGKIVTLSDGTADATAGEVQILSGYTAYAKGSKVTGSMPSLGEQTITPGTIAKTIPAGYYLSGQQTIAGDANLVPDNIAAGKSIFGVVGSYGGNVKSGSLETEYDSSRGIYIKYATVNLGFRPRLVIVYLYNGEIISFNLAFASSLYYDRCHVKCTHTSYGYGVAQETNNYTLALNYNGFTCTSNCTQIMDSNSGNAGYIAIP